MGLPMIFLFSYEYSFPMVFLRFLHGFPVVFSFKTWLQPMALVSGKHQVSVFLGSLSMQSVAAEKGDPARSALEGKDMGVYNDIWS